MSGQEYDLSNYDTIGLSYYFNCNNDFVPPTTTPPIEYIKIILRSLTGDKPVSRNSNDENYLFPVTVNNGEKCERIIVTANALYDLYGKSNNMDLNEFRRFLKTTLINNDTIFLRQPYPILVFSANYKVISYDYPDFLYFKEDPVALIRHYFTQNLGGYYYCFDDEQACVVEQLYHYGILVSDAAGAETNSTFFLSQADLIRLIRMIPESEKEKKWKEVFQDKKTRCNKILD